MLQLKWNGFTISTAVVLVLLWLGTWLWFAAASRPGPATAPTLASPPAESVSAARAPSTRDTLVHDLASADAPTKQAAADFLAQMTPRDLMWLQKQAADALDPDAKTQLSARAAALEDQLATHPPGISVHFKDATLADVVYTLNAEMGTDMEYRQGAGTGGVYSLDVTDQPFWEVIAALNAQQPFLIQAINGSPVLTVSDAPTAWGMPLGMTRHAISGPFFMYAYNRPLTGTTPPSFMLSYLILADPRIPVLDLNFDYGKDKPPNGVAVGPDSNGNVFKYMSRGGGGSGASHGPVRGFGGSCQLVWPDNPGVAIASLQASAGFTTGAVAASLEVQGIETKEGWQDKIGDVTVSMPQFELKNPQNPVYTFQFNVTPPEKGPLISLELIDKGNFVNWSGNAGTTGTVTANRSFSRPPYSLRVALAKSTHDLTASFVITDIPMPPRP